MTIIDESIRMLTPSPGKLLYSDGVYSDRVFLGVQDTAERWVEIDIPDEWELENPPIIAPVTAPTLEEKVAAIKETVTNLEATIDTMLTGG